jgi:hypothetical protein
MSHEQIPVTVHICTEKTVKEAIDTVALINSFIYVESEGNDSIRGENEDVGCLQITPIYIEDANRILGYEKYGLSDRYDRKKSIEMFMVVQKKYNPTLDLHLACKVQNPLAPLSYHQKVEKYYTELTAIK